MNKAVTRPLASAGVPARAKPAGTTFLAELALTLRSPDDWPLLQSMLDTAGQRATRDGEAVACLGATYVPEEGRLFCVFSAPTSEAVRKVLAAGNFATLRILPAIALASVDPTLEAA